MKKTRNNVSFAAEKTMINCNQFLLITTAVQEQVGLASTPLSPIGGDLNNLAWNY